MPTAEGNPARGDLVRVRQAGDREWTMGTVILASPEGRAIVVRLAGAVRAGEGYVMNVLPLMIDYENETVTGLTGHEYEMEVAG